MASAIIGAGNYGEVYLHYLVEDGKIDVAGFIDDDLSRQEVLGYPILGNTKDIMKGITLGVHDIFCSIGNNKIRSQLLSDAQTAGFKTPNYLHSSSIIAGDCKIGSGVYVFPGTIVMPYVTIQDYCMVSMGAKIAHHTILGRGVFVSTGVNVGASITIEENAFLGIGSTVMTGVKRIGKNAIIGAGAVVTKDVPDNAVVAGVPAKIIKYNSK